MTQDEITSAVKDIEVEVDPALKHLKLASLVSTLFRARGVELVVVGGSAIEFYTDGAYVSGDVDLCISEAREPVSARTRQEIMAQVKGKGGPRSWQVAGAYVDVLGLFENLARTPVRSIEGPFGEVRVCPVEELIVERVLVSQYPQDYPPARECARKMVAVALAEEVATDWLEVRRLAESRDYQNWTEVNALVDEEAKTLQVRSPYDPAR